VSEQALADIRRQAGLPLKLSADPTPVDVLYELTRPRSGGFPSQLAFWLAEYFRDHAAADNQYAKIYRDSLDSLTASSGDGAMAQIAGPQLLSGKLSKQDWESLIHGRVPLARLELRAGYAAARKFLADYWDRCTAKKTEPAMAVT
jgi:hypothetical protein